MPAPPLTPAQMKRVEILVSRLRCLDLALSRMAEAPRTVELTIKGEDGGLTFEFAGGEETARMLRSWRSRALAELAELGVTLSRWPDAPKVSPVPPPAPAPQPPPRRWPPASRWLDRFR